MPDTTYMYSIKAKAVINADEEQVLTASGHLIARRPFNAGQIRVEALKAALAEGGVTRPAGEYEVVQFTYTEVPTA